MPEFELIQRIKEIMAGAAGGRQPACSIGIGDDAAVLNVPPDRQLVVCTDTLVEGIHFLPDASPRSVGYKSLAVNLSDLAAMGADPAWFLTSLTLSEDDREWLESFAHGMAELARESGSTLAGGDITSGRLSICITALGLVENGQAMTRSGALPGDLVVVSGKLGEAANALAGLRAGRAPDAADLEALEFPRPRLALGRVLKDFATSCIDLSDGLLADLGHVLEQSGVGAELEIDSVPCSESLAALPPEERWPLQLSGGDDYELCFTIPASVSDRLGELEHRGGVDLTVIGAITSSPGLVLRKPDGQLYEAEHSGYEHFRWTGVEND